MSNKKLIVAEYTTTEYNKIFRNLQKSLNEIRRICKQHKYCDDCPYRTDDGWCKVTNTIFRYNDW